MTVSRTTGEISISLVLIITGVILLCFSLLLLLPRPPLDGVRWAIRSQLARVIETRPLRLPIVDVEDSSRVKHFLSSAHGDGA